MDYRFDELTTVPFDRCLDEQFDQTAEDARFHEDEIDVDLLPAQTVAATLPIGAREAYELFCDVARMPEWVSVVKSTSILSWTGSGRPEQVAYLSRLQGASIGYTITHTYDEEGLITTWSTPPGSATHVAGRAKFTPLGPKACLLEYKLLIELPEGALPGWDDPTYENNPATSVITDFRDFLNRQRDH